MSEQNFAQFKAALVALGADLDDSARRVVSNMADVGLNVTKKNTPVGQYSDGRVGGNARRGWVKSKALKLGNGWESGYTNNVYYVIYLNNGHRVVGKNGVIKGYVKGKRMLEQGMDATRRQSETLFRSELARVKAKGGW